MAGLGLIVQLLQIKMPISNALTLGAASVAACGVAVTWETQDDINLLEYLIKLVSIHVRHAHIYNCDR